MTNGTRKQDTSTVNRFRNQARWFSAELLIIVAGILIALAIDQWRENIEYTRLEREYLHQLVADLRTTVDMIAAVESENAGAENAAERLIAAFGNGEAVELKQVRGWLTAIGHYNNPVPVFGTVETLVSTGDLRLIGDVRIRTAITAYLSNSRDSWLIALINSEERHQESVAQLKLLAISRGIMPANIGGPTSRPLEQISPAELAELFGDPQAYFFVIDVADEKDFMARARLEMSSNATELKELVEPLISSF